VLGSNPVPGSAWDVALSRGAIYVADEVGITGIVNASVPPMLDDSLLTITPNGSSTTVAGAANALTGIAPVRATLTDTATGATSTPTPANSGGSFSATVTALPSHALSISATDAAARSTTHNLASTFGTTYTKVANQVVANDANYRARRVTSNGSMTFVSSGSTFGSGATTSSVLLLFKQPDATSPPQIVNSGVGAVNDVRINAGYLYYVGSRFGVINLSDPSLTTKVTGDPPGDEGSVAVSGGYAFTPELNYYNDGRIHIYNVATPDAPAFVRSQPVSGVGGFNYRSLLAYGTNYLIAISPDRPGGVDHDVTIIDRTNINNLVKVSELPIPNFDALDGVLDGTTLYVVGGSGGLAIVDVSNPASPQLKSVFTTPGVARGVAISGTNEIVVADATGLTVIDVTDKTRPFVIGAQKLIGNVTGVDVVGKTMTVAGETHYHTILRP
jgi:hypothetical protein